MDQFIFFEDIHEFAVQVCRTWGVPVPDFGTFSTKMRLYLVGFISDEVINWRIPLMTLTPGMKVHRMDMTLACMQERFLEELGELSNRWSIIDR